jgi:hypothetical protein
LLRRRSQLLPVGPVERVWLAARPPANPSRFMLGEAALRRPSISRAPLGSLVIIPVRQKMPSG